MTDIPFFPQFDQKQDLDASLNLISSIVGALSLLGCTFNIAITLFLGKSKIIIGKMVIILAVFDILAHLPLVFTSISFINDRVSCEILGSWVSFFGLTCSIFFTTCFAHALYQSIADISMECIEKNLKKYLALSLISGFIVGSLAVGFQYKEYHMYQNGPLCITRRVSGANWGSVFIILIPGTINIIGCTYFCIKLMRVLKTADKTTNRHWGLLIYPLILVICLFPTMLRRFFSLIGYDILTVDLFIQIGRGLFGAQGFLNSLAYGLSREMYKALKGRCCPSKEEPESLEQSVSVSYSEMSEEHMQIQMERQTINSSA